MKTRLYVILSIIVYAIINILAMAFLPFSQEFREIGSSENNMGIINILTDSIWICFTIFFIIKYSNIGRKKLFINIVCIIFFINSFNTQVEALLFNYTWTVLSKADVICLMLASLVSLLVIVPLMIKLFANKEGVIGKEKINIKDTLIKIGITGIIYLCLYMLFGYFVAWQFREVRIFYSGTPEKLSFFGQLANNIKTSPLVYPVQIIRGIIFGAFIVPLAKMVNKNKLQFIICVCLVYLSTAVVLIVPNVLFPDSIRFPHLIEMTTSMLLFGIIVGNILWKNKSKKPAPNTIVCASPPYGGSGCEKTQSGVD